MAVSTLHLQAFQRLSSTQLGDDDGDDIGDNGDGDDDIGHSGDGDDGDDEDDDSETSGSHCQVFMFCQGLCYIPSPYTLTITQKQVPLSLFFT